MHVKVLKVPKQENTAGEKREVTDIGASIEKGIMN